MNHCKAEYIWIDGNMPTAKLRSKTKIIEGRIKTKRTCFLKGGRRPV